MVSEHLSKASVFKSLLMIRLNVCRVSLPVYFLTVLLHLQFYPEDPVCFRSEEGVD